MGRKVGEGRMVTVAEPSKENGSRNSVTDIAGVLTFQLVTILMTVFIILFPVIFLSWFDL